MPDSAITGLLAKTTMESGVSVGNLTMFPLTQKADSALDYLLLDDALADESLEIAEISAEGSVPELRCLNKNEKPVLLLDGEELIGAKQNRILNLSILVPGKATINIPVSCVESGRWDSRGPRFRSGQKSQFAGGRASRNMQVSESLCASGERRSDQGRVWAEIDSLAQAFDTITLTSAMSDIYDEQKPRIDRFVKGLTAREDQIGALFLIDEKVAGLDIFDKSDTLARSMEKLVTSYAVDALRSGAGVTRLENLDDGKSFLRTVEKAECAKHPAVGVGVDIRFVTHGLTGGALRVDDSIVHLWAFPKEDTSSKNDLHSNSSMAAASVRRRFG